MRSITKLLVKTLLSDEVLEIANLLRHCNDSPSEGEIIPLRGVSKSGAGSIAHAAGAGRSVRGTVSVELQPLMASNDIAMQALNSFFSISQFSGVFGIQRSDIALAGLHIFDGGVCQTEIFSGLIALSFVGGGVGAVVVNRPGHGNYQADNDSTDD